MKELGIGIALAAAVFFTVSWLALRMAQEESRRWRRLLQLYFEKQVHAPLPIDEDPTAPADSALNLPDDELEELERLQEMEDEARAQRLS